jgi:hypothetical protein
MGFIDKSVLLDLAGQLKNSAYGQYLFRIAEETGFDTIS